MREPIVKYLSNSHGLAPEEAKPVMYMAEHRIQDEVIPNESVRATCNNCHALGRAFQWHRTREEWSLLADTHSALYTSRRRPHSGATAPEEAAAPLPPLPRGRGESRAARGAAARGARRPRRHRYRSTPRSIFWARTTDCTLPSGRPGGRACALPRSPAGGSISARMPGHGKYFGEMTIAPGAAPDEFTTTVKLQPVNGGPAITRTGTESGLHRLFLARPFEGRAPSPPTPRRTISTARCAKRSGSRPTRTGPKAAGSGASIRNSAST